MSINKLIVPNVETLRNFLIENGSIKFYHKYVRKVDVLIGDDDGIDFIEKFEIKYCKNDEEFNQLD
jgi:regulator of RNase E activity RraA